MTTSDDPSLSPDHAPASDASCMGSKLNVNPVLTSHPNGRRAPRDTALRRRRLQIVRQLKAIARLQEQIQEQRAEICSLESIIGAQADAIEALRRKKPDPKD